MSYVANKYNYSTPLQSSVSLVSEASTVEDRKYFVLSDNRIDGSYYPISGDVGLWGASTSDAAGNLSEPFVVTVTEDNTINAFRLVSSQYNYPVAFTVQFYNGDTLLHTITETANDKAEYINYLPKTLVVTHYVITVTKVSHVGSAARIYNVYDPDYVSRYDPLGVSLSEASVIQASTTYTVHSGDTVRIRDFSYTAVDAAIVASDNLAAKVGSVSHILNTIGGVADKLLARAGSGSHILNTIGGMADKLLAKAGNSSHILNTIGGATDKLVAREVENTSHVLNTIDVTHDRALLNGASNGYLTNVHTRMKEPTRRIYGKVYITYTDPILDSETRIDTNMAAYNSNVEQVTDGIAVSNGLFFTLYDNDLSGKYTAMSEQSQVGWVSGAVSGPYGRFSTPQYLRIDFSARPVAPLTIYFDDSHGCVAEDFTVEFIHEDDTSTIKSIVGNNLAQVTVNDVAIAGVTTVIISVTKVSKPYMPVAILDVPIMSVFLYKGYQDESKLMSIDLLEELTYDDEVEALGGMSANEVTVVLDNSDSSFYANSNSIISGQLKRNRKIEPWLGVEIVPGEIEWYKQGTFWSYRWNVPVKGLTARVVGFDTIGLLGTTDFTNHHTLINKSLGELIEYVLTDAKASLDFLCWNIDPALYDVVVPYAWFAHSNHAAALRKICQAYPMHIYCDKDGIVCAAPQKLRLDHYYDTWSDSTNVIDKDYNSLYTTIPNNVTVSVHIPHEEANSQLVTDNLVFDVADVPTRTLNFSKPYLSDLAITVDKDSTVAYTYEVYSWGIEFTFSGTGKVRSIVCTGTSLDVSNTSVLTRRDADSIRVNGAVTREVSADFIQTSELASLIINRIFELATYDKYDATVVYRGDIALSINDPIRLLDGIAPDNRYNIRRHKLSWNGALTGTADLNT